MTFYQLAMRYLVRKRAKTVLLFFVFVFIGSMVLSTSMILRATSNAKELIQEKTNAKIIAEAGTEKDKISENEIREASLLDGVASINRSSYNFAFAANFSPLTNSESEEEDNERMVIFTYDDLQNDSAFYEQRYRLIAGDYISPDMRASAVINSLLADVNGLKTGDEIKLQTGDGLVVSAEIVGLFISGSERRQANTTLAVNRVENQIFVDNNTYSQMFPNDGYYKVAVYARNPEKLGTLEESLRVVFSDKIKLTTSDTLFRKTKAPLEQTIHVVKGMLVLTFVTGTVVLTILLCMWMRTRKKEAAILVSIGKSKISILLQVLLESFAVFWVSVLGACGGGSLAAKVLKSFLVGVRTADVSFTVSLKLPDIVLLLGIGSFIVLIAVTASIFPILRANPKDMLSRMEG